MKLFEVMGFTTFNIMVAMVLSATFFTKVEENLKVTALTKQTVTKFI